MLDTEVYVAEPEIDYTSVIVDGKFFSHLKEKMMSKFKKQLNPEERVKKLEENALNIFAKIKRLENENVKNLLLVGKVQSGKTSNMQMALSLAFDNGYNLMVLYGGYDNTLLDQAITRFGSEAFAKPEEMSDEQARLEWVNIFSTRPGKCFDIYALDGDVVDEILNNDGKIIIICLKSPENISKVNNILSRLDLTRIKALIFDDEGDQASLNNEFRKGGKSATYEQICEMKKILKNPPYLSVTATPQALVFSPKTSELKPKSLQLIYPGEGYTGMSDFHLNDEKVIDVEDDIDTYLEKNPPQLSPSLWNSLFAYFITSAILLKNGVLDKTQMIIHFDKLTKKHEQIYNLIKNYTDSIQENIRNNQNNTIENKLNDMKRVFDDPSVIVPSMKGDLQFDDIKNELKIILKKVYPALMNGKGKDTMAGLDWKKWQIRVGADLLQRGVSFDELVTTYFTRWPKGRSNMDTQIQRARWLGYRKKFFDYCHVYTTNNIDYMFGRLAQIEEDLWSQMLEIESGAKILDDIMVEADPGLRPSRRSAADYSAKTFGRRWLNQSIAVFNDDLISRNNTALLKLIDKYEFVPIKAGSTKNDPDRITGYKARISFDDLRLFINETIAIFDNNPFGGTERLLKVVKDYSIDIVLFWDKKTVEYSKLDLHEKEKNARTRKFVLVESNYRVSALQQGADKTDEATKKYLGDSYVFDDSNAVTIQVSPIMPIAEKSPKEFKGKFQFMYSIRVPNAVSVYTKGED